MLVETTVLSTVTPDVGGNDKFKGIIDPSRWCKLTGRREVVGFEVHDAGLALEELESGFWNDDILVVCQTGESFSLTEASRASVIKGNDCFWFDTGKEHIITNSLFRNCCGYRSDEFNQYDEFNQNTMNTINTTRHQIEVAATLIIRWVVNSTHIIQLNPEGMQGTKTLYLIIVGLDIVFTIIVA